MSGEHRHRGFSLTEVLLAVGTLAVAMLFIAGTFLVAVHFAMVTTERTTAALAADEAFAKIRLYGVNPGSLQVDRMVRFAVDPNESAYPSTDVDASQKQYCWSALCRLVQDPNRSRDDRLVQVTVFACRRVGSGSTYPPPPGSQWPAPAPVAVSFVPGGMANELAILQADERRWINDGYTMVDDNTGEIYRVLRRDDPDLILLDRDWTGPADPNELWVVPPARGRGKNPCIAVYQKVIGF